jgi:hypothetical protein
MPVGRWTEVVATRRTPPTSLELRFHQALSRLFVRDIGELAILLFSARKPDSTTLKPWYQGKHSRKLERLDYGFTGTKVFNKVALVCEYPALYWNGSKWTWRGWESILVSGDRFASGRQTKTDLRSKNSGSHIRKDSWCGVKQRLLASSQERSSLPRNHGFGSKTNTAPLLSESGMRVTFLTIPGLAATRLF